MELHYLSLFFFFAACGVVLGEGQRKCEPVCEAHQACVIKQGVGFCETHVDGLVDVLCQALSCVNGTCEKVMEVNEHGAYIHLVCDCEEGYVGLACDVKCPYCDASYQVCLLSQDNEAVCQVLPPEDWNCADGTCLNGGSCNNLTNANENTTLCNCAENYEGMTCGSLKKGGRQFVPEIIIDENVCQPNPCGGDCECKPSCKHELGYYCVSEDGYIGKNCDIAIPFVLCTENNIEIEVSSLFYQEFDKEIGNSYIYVSPEADSTDRCIAYSTLVNTFKVVIPLPFTDCMTTIDTNDVVASGISFMNKLWINRNTGGPFDMPVPVLNFTCIYARDYTATTSLMPLVDENVAVISKSGSFAAEFSLCKQEICDNSCPSYLQVHNAAVYTVGQMIHFNVKIITKQDEIFPGAQFVTTLEKIFLSCSSDRFDMDSMLTMMATAGCPSADQMFSFTMRSGATSTPQSVCGSIQVPRSTADNCQQIYIHAEILLCLTGDLQTCSSDNGNNFCTSAARKRRSAEENLAFAVIGPITIIPGSKGHKIEDLYLQGTTEGIVTFKDDVILPDLVVKPNLKESPVMSTTANDIAYYSPVILIIGIVSFAISCITIVAFILVRLFRFRHQPPPNKAMEMFPQTA
uniref:Transmembrane protein Vc569 n=1 Tax=Phallusia mammillata TaxID=59560 RepID=A0A6F9DVU5_9ASCI|nr:transmembrane protein Vc569 [Phallusia mammillata]